MKLVLVQATIRASSTRFECARVATAFYIAMQGVKLSGSLCSSSNEQLLTRMHSFQGIGQLDTVWSAVIKVAAG